MTLPKIEWKINAGHIISLLVLIVGFIAGYARIQARQESMEKELHEHMATDAIQFASFATKETRLFRDKEVDSKLDDIIKRLDRIERMHMTNVFGVPK